MKVGDLVPLTGRLAAAGSAGRKAADLAVDLGILGLRNARVEGVQVLADHIDTRTDPRAAVLAGRQVLSRQASCLAGPWSSPETLAVARELAVPQRVPLISPAATDAEITALDDDGYVFRTIPSDSLQAEGLADVVERSLGSANRTISVAASDDASGHAVSGRFRTAWEAKGGRVLGPVLYRPAKTGYGAEARRVVSGDPDGYVIFDTPRSYARMGAALVRTGRFDASKLFVGGGLAGEDFPPNVPSEALDGARGLRPSTPTKGSGPSAFDRLYRQTALPPQARHPLDAQNFDAVTLCFLASLAAGSSEPEAVRKRIREVSGPPGQPVERVGDAVALLRQGRDIDYQGASGPLDLDANGDPTAGDYDLLRYEPGRAVRLLGQVEARQGHGVTGVPGRRRKVG